MMKLLQEMVRNRLNDFRAIDRLVSSFDFGYLYDRLDERSKNTLSEIVRRGDKTAVLEFIRHHEQRAIEEFSIRKLREMAGQLAIEYYSQLSKADLIAIILRVKNDARAAG